MTYIVKRKFQGALGDNVDSQDMANILQHIQDNPVSPATFQDELTLNRLTVISRNKIPVGADKYNTTSQEGGIGSVVATTLVQTSIRTGYRDILHVSGTTYLIAYIDNSTADGFVESITITNAGTVTASVDSLEFADATTVTSPRLFHVAGDVYGVAFSHASTRGKIMTFTCSSAGAISNSIVSSGNFDSNRIESHIDVLHISGNVFAIAYGLFVGISQDDGYITTISIDINGTVGAVIDTLKFEDTYCRDPHITRVGTSDYYAISFEGPSGDGWIVTVGIDSAGNIGAAITDSLEFSTNNVKGPTIFPISGSYYGIAYDENNLGAIATTTISSAGVIAASTTSIGYFEFLGTLAGQLDIILLSNGFYAIVYKGVDNDGWLATIPITSAGIVGTKQDSFEFLASDTVNYPKIVHISGTIYAIFYKGGGNNAYIKTINIGSTRGAGFVWVEDDKFRFIDENGTERASGDIDGHSNLDTGVHGVTGVVLGTEDVDDTPVNGAATIPVSSNWAYDHENILTTKGDLLTYGTALTRHGVGSNGEFLVPNSSNSNGLEWVSIVTYEGTVVINNDGVVYA